MLLMPEAMVIAALHAILRMKLRYMLAREQHRSGIEGDQAAVAVAFFGHS
ncbi:hypothetical protein J2T47_001109 [Pseudomonas nitroreducens]|nr:hypothetical protein [Pseudomonas nitroreducens]